MIRFFVFALAFLLPNAAQAQFDFLGAAQKVFTASRPILTEMANDPETVATVKTNATSLVNALSTSDIDAGLRQALSLSATKVTNQLGMKNGFYGDSQIKIPLPEKLQTAHQMLGKIGLESLGNNLELKMNRAAEMAMPQAQKLFVSSIKKMTLSDAQNILTGPDDAATQFFRGTMGNDLITALLPIVKTQLKEVNDMQTYDQLVQQYASIPFAPAINTDLSSYVATLAVDGMFNYMAAEEAAIRTNPVERSTDLLKKVFAAAR